MKSPIAIVQPTLGAADLGLVLAMVRGGTLAAAGERLHVDASTVFRSLQRIERGLGVSLFERSRKGYQPTELGRVLAAHGEQIEVSLETARSAAQLEPAQVSGTVRVTTTDTILHGLVAPTLAELRARHPSLAYELDTTNELASLTRRDADIALRATKRPPQHLVGKRVGTLHLALYSAKTGRRSRPSAATLEKAAWIAPDDALPEHPSVLWRRRHFPRVQPTYLVNSIQTVTELVAQGLGVGILPLFLAEKRPDLMPLTDILKECETDLWLLTHPESRHLRRVATVYGHLSTSLSLPMSEA